MNSPQPVKKPSRLPLVLLVVALALAAALWFFRPDAAPKGNLSGSAVGGAFSLVDETGAPVSNDSFDGKWRLMYFGFTYCPDICPTDTATMAAAIRLFEEKHPDEAKKLQPIFVTVDPERDTPAALAEFTSGFHPRLLGLTGSHLLPDGPEGPPGGVPGQRHGDSGTGGRHAGALPCLSSATASGSATA
jgi:cytochrome oxidase Cu insertion factor (SCO1/SenC/PrrC family)